MSYARKRKMKNRVAFRKKIEGITVSNVSILKPFCLLTQKAILMNASSHDLLLLIHRKDLIPKYLRNNLTLESIKDSLLVLTIDQMELTLSGHVKRTAMVGHGQFEVAVDYSQEASDYFRECLFTLLPNRGEFDNDIDNDMD